MTTGQLLEEFILNDSSENNFEKLIFLQDVILCQGIIAWRNIKVMFTDTEIGEVELNDDSWKELWEFSEFEIDDFATILGKKYSEAEDVLKRLIFLKYIYPDGKVNDIALAYAKNVSKSMLTKVMSKSKINKQGDNSNGREN